MQSMAQGVGFCIPPIHHLTIHPDYTISVVKRDQRHYRCLQVNYVILARDKLTKVIKLQKIDKKTNISEYCLFLVAVLL